MAGFQGCLLELTSPNISHVPSLRPERVICGKMFLQQVNTKTYTNNPVKPADSEQIFSGTDFWGGRRREVDWIASSSILRVISLTFWPTVFQGAILGIPCHLFSRTNASPHGTGAGERGEEARSMDQQALEDQEEYEDYTEQFWLESSRSFFLTSQIAHLCPQQLSISSEDTNNVSNVLKIQYIYICTYIFIYIYIYFMWNGSPKTYTTPLSLALYLSSMRRKVFL